MRSSTCSPWCTFSVFSPCTLPPASAIDRTCGAAAATLTVQARAVANAQRAKVLRQSRIVIAWFRLVGGQSAYCPAASLTSSLHGDEIVGKLSVVDTGSRPTPALQGSL